MTARRAVAGCAALGLVLLVTAVILAAVLPSGRVVAGTPAPPAAAGAVPGTGTGTVGNNPPTAPRERATPPAPGARLQLPRLRLDAPVVSVRLDGRVMQVPRNPGRVGWWRAGAVPGAAQGSAVIVGHVNYGGTSGAFAVLPRTRPGDRIVLTRPRLAFHVVAVRSYPKTSGIPQSVFAPGGPGRLVLITCGGSFDAATGNYRDNVVVYAVRG